MLLRTTLNLRRASFWSTALVGLCCGCAAVPQDKDAAARDESFTEAAQYQRKPEKAALPFAVSDKARQIEQDFGVRR